MASTYLNRSAVTGNRRTFTISAWVKRSELGTEQQIYSSRSSASNVLGLYFQGSNDTLLVTDYQSGGTMSFTTSAVYRDVSAWYHIVLAVDTTQATDTNRVKLYINGEQATFSSSSYPNLNTDLYINVSGSNHYIGTEQSGRYFNGQMAHFHFIDGTAYDASAFGETDATTGIWKPKTAPSVTYGTNGFFLKFENSGSMGTDSSGNANNFTVNGTPTQTVDTPSNVFATGNPLYVWNYNQTQTNGNTSFAGTQSQWQGASGTLGISKGKWYYEAKITNDNGLANGSTAMLIGFMGLDDYNLTNAYRNFVGHYSYDGGKIWTADTATNTASPSSYGTFAVNDIAGIALDYDNELISVYKNGTALVTNFDYGAVATSTTLKGGKTITPVFVSYGVNSVSANFGNGYFGTTAVASGNADDNGLGIFEYAPPTGYLALCTKNINAQEYA